MSMAIPIIMMILFLIMTPIAVVIVISLTKKGERIDVEPNQPLIEIKPDRLQFTEQYSEGVIKAIRKNKNNTCLIEFYPFDVYQGGTEPRPEFKSFIIHESYIKSYSPGEWGGSRRAKIKTIAKEISLLPKKMRSDLIKHKINTNNMRNEDETTESRKALMSQATGIIEKNNIEAFHEYLNEETTLGMSRKKQKKLDSDYKNAKKIAASEPRQSPESLK